MFLMINIIAPILPVGVLRLVLTVLLAGSITLLHLLLLLGRGLDLEALVIRFIGCG